jgi:hypothetical protein
MPSPNPLGLLPHYLGVGVREGSPSGELVSQAYSLHRLMDRMQGISPPLDPHGLLGNHRYPVELDALYPPLLPVHQTLPMHGLLGHHHSEFLYPGETRVALVVLHTYNHNMAGLGSSTDLKLASNHHKKPSVMIPTTGAATRAEIPPYPIPGLPVEKPTMSITMLNKNPRQQVSPMISSTM